MNAANDRFAVYGLRCSGMSLSSGFALAKALLVMETGYTTIEVNNLRSMCRILCKPQASTHY